MSRRSWMLALIWAQEAEEAREMVQQALRGQEEEPEQPKEGEGPCEASNAA